MIGIIFFTSFNNPGNSEIWCTSSEIIDFPNILDQDLCCHLRNIEKVSRSKDRDVDLCFTWTFIYDGYYKITQWKNTDANNMSLCHQLFCLIRNRHFLEAEEMQVFNNSCTSSLRKRYFSAGFFKKAQLQKMPSNITPNSLSKCPRLLQPMNELKSNRPASAARSLEHKYYQLINAAPLL